MNRRRFLQLGALTLMMGSSGLVAAAAPPPRFVSRVKPRDRILVCLFLRGGVDGLYVAAPLADPDYRRARRKLALPRSSPALDARFALNPVMAPLLPLYREGVLAFVHAIGSSFVTRSHFAAQDFLESGGGFSAQRQDGWMNRLMRRSPAADPSPFRALATVPGIPISFRGEYPVTSLPGLDSLQSAEQQRLDRLLTRVAPSLAGSRDGQMRAVSAATTRMRTALRGLDPKRYRAGAAYPQTALADQLKLVAFLVKSRAGLEVAYAELDGFDTHARQVGPEGIMDPLLGDVARSLAAFWKDLGPYQDRVVLVTMTEFGRRVAENGSLGTDHGCGSCCLVLGGGVKGGRVVADWPGLAPERLVEGLDLAVTTEYRDLFMEVARHIGCPQPQALFPGFGPARAVGVLQ